MSQRTWRDVSRKRLALWLAVPTLVVVLLFGLSRNRETNDFGPAPETTLPAEVGEDAADAAVLQPVDEVIEVPEGTDCNATSAAETPTCQAFDIQGVEVAWLVESSGAANPVASFLRRESGTSWRRVLTADGGARGFERVNVRSTDLTADGLVETAFAFHTGNDLQLDVVDDQGVVLLHLDLPDGQALVDAGRITTFLREGDRWRKQEITLENGEVTVVADDLVDGPAEGNI